LGSCVFSYAASLCDPAKPNKYVIITSAVMRDASTDYNLRTLRDHRISHGLTTAILTTEDIYANYTGISKPEKLRAFISDAVKVWKTEFVLLAGDGTNATTGIIPVQHAYTTNTQTTKIPCDMFYSCLSGTWDADNDGRYGEADGDKPNWNSTVSIGRASAETVDEMANFVYKTITYDNSPVNASYHTKGLMYTTTDVGKFSDWRFSTPRVLTGMPTSNWGAGFQGDQIENTYDFLMNVPVADVNVRWNSYSYGSFWVGSHGSPAGMGYYDKAYADKMTNGPVFPFMATLACLSGKFDEDCYAEHLTTSTRTGGAVAVVFNSQLGYPFSNAIMQKMIDASFTRNLTTFGKMLTHAKNAYIAEYPAGNDRLWTAYAQTLFGDPALKWKSVYATSIQAHFAFDENSGITTKDLSLNTSIGTMKNNAVRTLGKYGKGIEFDGINSYVECSFTHWSPMGRQPELTVTAWIKPAQLIDNAGIVTKGKLKVPFSLQLASDGKIKFTANQGTPANGSGTGSWSTAFKAEVNKWVHVAATYSMADSTLRFYINGKIESAVYKTPLFFGWTREPLFIGCDMFSGENFFKGTIDDVRVYGRALKLNEVLSVMNNDRELCCTFDNAAGTSFSDQSYSPVTVNVNSGFTNVDGLKSKAVVLNGTNQSFSIADNARFDIRRRISFCAWVNISKYDAPIVSKGSVAIPYQFTINSSGNLCLIVNKANPLLYTEGGTFSSNGVVSKGVWHHVALTYDGDMVRFYIDGKMDSRQIDASFVMGRNDEPLLLGTDNSRYFGGSIDELCIYNRAVSADEIMEMSSLSGTFVIVASAGAGGTISPSGSMIKDSGSSQSFAIAANAGYKIKSVLVDNVDKGPLTSFTLTNIKTNSSVSAVFALITEIPKQVQTITTYSFAIKNRGIVTDKLMNGDNIIVMDLKGRVVYKNIIDGTNIVWNYQPGHCLAEGMFIVNIKGSNLSRNHKLTLLKQ
jgi:hypothetical protein